MPSIYEIKLKFQTTLSTARDFFLFKGLVGDPGYSHALEVYNYPFPPLL